MSILEAIRDANPAREAGNLHRRIIKLGEEYGEVSEAYLNVTSPANGKGMTWDDVREEFADVLIVAVDVALTPLPRGRVDMLESIYERLPGAYAVPEDNLNDLMLTIMERLGRVSRTFVSYTLNSQNVGYLQGAMCDLVLVAFEAATARMPDQLSASREALMENLAGEVERKLTKWQNNRDTGRVATDVE